MIYIDITSAKSHFGFTYMRFNLLIYLWIHSLSSVIFRTHIQHFGKTLLFSLYTRFVFIAYIHRIVMLCKFSVCSHFPKNKNTFGLRGYIIILAFNHTSSTHIISVHIKKQRNKKKTNESRIISFRLSRLSQNELTFQLHSYLIYGQIILKWIWKWNGDRVFHLF